MDYNKYSQLGYSDLMPYFESLSKVLQNKINQVSNISNVVGFGFSFGSRMLVEAGINLATTGSLMNKIYGK